MATPTISVITPNYNHASHLAHCVESVAQQIHPVLEHVIVDDGSTDDSRAVLEGLQARYPHLRVIFQGQNRGVALTVERAVGEARGDFVIGLAADDVLLPCAIENFMAVLLAHPDAVYVCGEIELVSATSTRHLRYLDVPEPTYLSPDQLVAHQRGMLKVINGASIMRRDLIANSALFDRALQWSSDFIAHAAITYRYGLWYVPHIVHRFTVSGTNFSLGRHSWKSQKPVLDRMFLLLDTPAYSDVRNRFIGSAVLAELPHILRYLTLRPKHWDFLTLRLAMNAMTLLVYRKIRQFMPGGLLRRYIAWRSARAA